MRLKVIPGGLYVENAQPKPSANILGPYQLWKYCQVQVRLKPDFLSPMQLKARNFKARSSSEKKLIKSCKTSLCEKLPSSSATSTRSCEITIREKKIPSVFLNWIIAREELVAVRCFFWSDQCDSMLSLLFSFRNRWGCIIARWRDWC